MFPKRLANLGAPCRVETFLVDAVVDDDDLFRRDRIVSNNVTLDFFRYRDDFRRSRFSILPPLESQQTLMVDAHPLPQSAPHASLLPQTVEEPAVRAAATAQNILAQQPSETDDDFTTGFLNGSRREPRETPQTHSSAQRYDPDIVSPDPARRFHGIFAAKQMDFVS
jgi:hypothetical protein